MTRAGLIIATALATMGVGYPGLTPMPIKLIWNASASAPIGFYTIDFDGPFEVTDLVAVDAPEPLATFLADRGYLPKGVPLMKRVLAVSGQTVCRTNLTITVDRVEVEEADAVHLVDPVDVLLGDDCGVGGWLHAMLSAEPPELCRT